jgi:hypothetical protein
LNKYLEVSFLCRIFILSKKQNNNMEILNKKLECDHPFGANYWFENGQLIFVYLFRNEKCASCVVGEESFDLKEVFKFLANQTDKDEQFFFKEFFKDFFEDFKEEFLGLIIKYMELPSEASDLVFKILNGNGPKVESTPFKVYDSETAQFYTRYNNFVNNTKVELFVPNWVKSFCHCIKYKTTPQVQKNIELGEIAFLNGKPVFYKKNKHES